MPLATFVLSPPAVALLLAQFSLAAGLVGVGFGLRLLLNAHFMRRVSVFMNRWVSLRQSTRSLNVPRDIGPLVERHRIAVGTAFIVIAAASLYSLATQVSVARLEAALRISSSSAVVHWIVESVYWFLIVGDAIAIAAGVLLVAFPDAMRRLESHANHWYSFRHATPGADTMHTGIDRGVQRFARAAGAAITTVATGISVSSLLQLGAFG